MKGNLIIISSPSGGGKGTLIKEVLKIVPNIGYSVSYTTRTIREGEEDGRHRVLRLPQRRWRVVPSGRVPPPGGDRRRPRLPQGAGRGPPGLPVSRATPR